MREQEILKRIDSLLTTNPSGHEAFSGALGLLTSLYGPHSPQVDDLTKKGKSFSDRFAGGGLDNQLTDLAQGVLQNLKTEIELGIVTSLSGSITGDVLTDFLKLARAILGESGEGAKNVAAVLAAALFEDTLRRIATQNGIPHIEKLQDLLTELKGKQILQGTQIGIANSYLYFRNSALHAQWDRVERESVVSVLGFLEQLLMKHFP